jgi:DNA-binding transcriptional regulator YiaG
MEYTKRTIDRSTGELVTASMGEWKTITEVAQACGVGSRKFRAVLKRMAFLQLEYSGRDWRHRLAPWVTDQGWGKRLIREQDGRSTPFDVVSPEAQDWIRDRLQVALAEMEAEVSPDAAAAIAALDDFRTARNEYRAKLTNGKEMSVEEMVRCLSDFYPNLSQPEIATALHVTQQLVSRYQDQRSRYLKYAVEKRGSKPGPIPAAALRSAFSRSA